MSDMGDGNLNVPDDDNDGVPSFVSPAEECHIDSTNLKESPVLTKQEQQACED